MRKGENAYSNSENQPFYFVPMSNQYLPPEEFRFITDQVAPGIKPYYMISNYGRIWHIYKNKFLTFNIDSKGYLYKPLSTIQGPKNFRIHRLVLMTFCFIPGCENLYVNHKDGIKTNCIITNLEWVTAKENSIHAVNTGLNTYKRVDDETIHKICRMLESGNPQTEIAKECNVNVQMVSAIANKRSHCNISDLYNISQRKIPSHFTEEQVHMICKFYEANKPYQPLNQYYTDAVRFCGIECDSLKMRAAQKIFTKDSYRNISKNYNF